MVRYIYTGSTGYRFGSPISGGWFHGAKLSLFLIIIHFAFWLVYIIGEYIAMRGDASFSQLLSPYLAISYENTFQNWRLWTLVTYMFLHFHFMHFFWNNILILFFSPQIERDFGRKSFVIFYLLCGVGAALVSIIHKLIAGIAVPTIGASGAIMGILVAYGMTYPNQTVYVFGIFPFKMRTLLIIIVVIQFAMTIQPGAATLTDYWAHIGGLLTGFIYMLIKRYRDNGPGSPRSRIRNWRGEDTGPERSYYLEM